MELLEQITLAERIDIYMEGSRRFKSSMELAQITADLRIEILREFGNNSTELLEGFDAQYKAYLSKYEQ